MVRKRRSADPSWTASDIDTNADGARSVYVADMDDDGDLDIVSASEEDDTIAWYENDGAPTHRGRHPTSTPMPTVLIRSTLPTWTVTVISTSFLHRILTTPLRGMRTTAADPTWTASDIATSADGARSVFCRFGR